MKRLSQIKTLNAFIKQNSETFLIHFNTLMCIKCNKKLEYNPKQGLKTLKTHALTQSHIRACNIKVIQSRLELAVVNDDFQLDLVNKMTKSNIPLSKLANPILKSFLQRYTGKVIYDEVTTERRSLTGFIYKNMEK